VATDSLLNARLCRDQSPIAAPFMNEEKKRKGKQGHENKIREQKGKRQSTCS
jgi:hypothetical protein